jgi:hypothetical protein
MSLSRTGIVIGNVHKSLMGRYIMAGKKLAENSVLNECDVDGDGIVTDEEIERHRRLLEIEDADAMRDAQRNMAWFALFGMLLYPFAVVMAELIGLSSASKILGDMAPTYFVSVAAIVAAFYGKSAMETKAKSSTPAPKSPSGAKPL